MKLGIIGQLKANNYFEGMVGLKDWTCASLRLNLTTKKHKGKNTEKHKADLHGEASFNIITGILSPVSKN